VVRAEDCIRIEREVSLCGAYGVIGYDMLWQVYILSAFYTSASLFLLASVLIVLCITTSAVVGVYLHHLCLFQTLHVGSL
jgi:hypothetical protein